MKLILDISDPAQLAGLAEANIASDSGLSDEEYLVARVMDVLNSYAKQFGYSMEEYVAKATELVALDAKLTEKGIK